jgi:hypothetical protein
MFPWTSPDPRRESLDATMRCVKTRDTGGRIPYSQQTKAPVSYISTCLRFESKVMRILAVPLLVAMSASAQVSSPPPRTTASPPTAPAAPTRMQPATAPDVTAGLPQLNQFTESARVDLARLRIDKWKTDANDKRQMQSNSESLQRNLTAALPAIIEQARANPSSVAAAFKLYRNLNALYDVMSTVTEAAGAFGSREEYQALAADTTNLDNLRRSLADRVEAMAGSRDTEIAQLQARARQAAAAAAAAPPKKVVVDDTEPVKKSTKKSTTKKKTTATEQQNPPK